MNSFSPYLLEITIGSGILYLGYLLVRNSTSPAFNRFYLLGCIFLPIVFCFIEIPSAVSVEYFIPAYENSYVDQTPPTITDFSSNYESVEISSQSPDVEAMKPTTTLKSRLDWRLIFQQAYLLIGLGFLIKILLSLIAIYRLKQNGNQSENGDYWILDKDGFIGASFFHLIFIHRRFLDTSAFDFLLTHESIHKKQFHSMDLMLAEIYRALFWINPVAWFLSKEIRVNAEIETDAILSRQMNVFDYSRLLVNLSGVEASMMNLFGAFATKKRIKKLISPGKPNFKKTLLITPFLLATAWLISCQADNDLLVTDPSVSLDGIKTITSRYISHQEDTQQKDGKIIAVASFLPDGTLDKVTQHTTYPYTFDLPKSISFFANPTKTGVSHIIDGLSLGHAEKNLLYGNDWPKRYADAAQLQHPKAYKNEFTKFETKITSNSNNLPSIIQLDQTPIGDNDNFGFIKDSYQEEFSYEGQKISHYESKILTRKSAATRSASFSSSDTSKILEQARETLDYTYDGDLLSAVQQGKDRYSFKYEGNYLTESDFSIEGKVYNQRKYFYDENGLKTRTDILNVYGQPEYTIVYDYEFYED